MSVDEAIRYSMQTCPMVGGPQTFVDHLKTALRAAIEEEMKKLLHSHWLSMPGISGIERHQGATDLVETIFGGKKS